MRKLLSIGLLIVFLPLVLACEPADEQIVEDDEGQLVLGTTEVEETMSRGVTPGDRVLVLEGYRGHIRLEGGDEDSADLNFTKRARGDDQESARATLDDITVDESGAEDEYLYQMSSTQEQMTAVDIEGTVPRNARLRIEMESGSIALSDISGSLDITTSNGHITLAGVANTARVRVENGHIDVGTRELADDAEVDLQTTNGNIYFTMPDGASVRLEAETQTGNIRVEDLDFTNRRLSAQAAGANFSGQLGTGQVPVRLRTTNGSIHLREGMITEIDPDMDPAEEELYHFPDVEDPDTAIVDDDTLRDPLPSDTLDADTLDVQ